VILEGEHGAEFISVDYPLSDAVRLRADGGHLVRFVAADGPIAGDIYGVRLLSKLPGQPLVP
jgi:hypothetical protein